MSSREERLSTSSTESIEWARVCGAQVDDISEDLSCQSCGDIQSSISSWDFNPYEISGGGPIEFVTSEIFRIQQSDIRRPEFTSVLRKVFQRADLEYNTVWLESSPVRRPSYHNSAHGADVCQAFYILLTTQANGGVCLLDRISICSGIDRDVVLCACIFASCMHDFGHFGFNNDFLVNTRSPIAHRYNDKSVLENFHCASSFELLWQVIAEVSGDGKIIPGITLSEYTQFRELVIGMILSTDMSLHYELTATIPCPSRDYRHCLALGLHCADVSSSARPWFTSRMWVGRIMDELFEQGDFERRIGKGPIKAMMNREIACIYKIQISFIDVIVRPLFVHMHIVCPFLGAPIRTDPPRGESRRYAGGILGIIDENRLNWQSLESTGN
jgi:cAMP-specific phosphodiesterase 4/high affinity cAMP-specific and IBMX-insensitive 3',5'-cyclic phosphodiesterase 8